MLLVHPNANCRFQHQIIFSDETEAEALGVGYFVSIYWKLFAHPAILHLHICEHNIFCVCVYVCVSVLSRVSCYANATCGCRDLLKLLTEVEALGAGYFFSNFAIAAYGCHGVNLDPSPALQSSIAH